MIGLKFKNIETKTFEFPEAQVKSISAAWNQIREWRNTIPVEVLDGTILSVDADGEPIQSDKIPAEILFKVNKKGKIEFKDNSKQKPQDAPEEMKVGPVVEQSVALKKAPNDYTCVTKRGPVNIRKIFNPAFYGGFTF